MKIFFDVNVFLDIAIRKEKDLQFFDPILISIQEGKIRGYLTTGVIQTSTYFLLKYLKYPKTKEVLSYLLPYFHFLEGKKIHVKDALDMEIEDIEDAIFYQIALDHEMDAILTNDKVFLKISKPHLPILTAVQLLEKLDK
jgi:predicted nucleic acid-binding protein